MIVIAQVLYLLFIFPLIIIIMVWAIPFTLQMIIMTIMPERWCRFLDAQLGKKNRKIDPEEEEITYALYFLPFMIYSFQYPFIRKRATSQSRIFKCYKIALLLNSIWIYSLIVFVVVYIPLDKLGYL